MRQIGFTNTWMLLLFQRNVGTYTPAPLPWDIQSHHFVIARRLVAAIIDPSSKYLHFTQLCMSLVTRLLSMYSTQLCVDSRAPTRCALLRRLYYNLVYVCNRNTTASDTA
jgi:hypothetical protein